MTPRAMTEQQHKLATRVLERIEAFPDTHDQSTWYRNRTQPVIAAVRLQGLGPVQAVDVAEMHECGAVACAAGHTILAAHELGIPIPQPERSAEDPAWLVAGELLGLRDGEQNHLFLDTKDDLDARGKIAAAVEHRSWDAAL